MSKTPKHDALVLWLDKEAATIAADFFPKQSDWSAAQTAKFRKHMQGDPPAYPGLRIVEKIWERPVNNHRGTHIIGFIDLAVCVGLPWIDVYEATQGSGDYIASINYNMEWLLFEAKPVIDSIGEVIRQVRTYENHLRGQYVVASWDGKYADVFREQRIGFVLAGGGQEGLSLS
jgi:hypothetical protein